MLLVDTSVWIDHIRGNRTRAVTALDRALVQEAEVALTEWIYLELLQGARSEHAFAKLKRYFSPYPVLRPTRGLETFAAAADLYRRCRGRGHPRSAGDCLIAVVAVEHGVPLLHSDRDFVHIAEVESRLMLVKLTAT
ncbi:MAG: PIN domain-containing protein [Comamonadaceae bacterium]|nr:PIN domain-containing protein [Comamonadaceae bacterium]